MEVNLNKPLLKYSLDISYFRTFQKRNLFSNSFDFPDEIVV